MNRLLWALQILLGIYFVAIGIMHFIVPEGLPEPMAWMYELSDPLHIVSGTAEILGGLGLILPGLTRVRPDLTVWAAVGLALVMLGAIVFHIARGEFPNIFLNLILAGLLVFVARRRSTTEPLTA